MNKTAIFVDGAFFIKRAYAIFGPLEPKELADKLWTYSLIHLYPHRSHKNARKFRDEDFHYAMEHLYRIFFYDCPPLQKKMRECKIVCVKSNCADLFYAPYWGKQLKGWISNGKT